MLGPKLGPKGGSLGWVSRFGFKLWYQGLVQRFGPTIGPNMTMVPRLGTNVRAQGCVPRLGPMEVPDSLIHIFSSKAWLQCWAPR